MNCANCLCMDVSEYNVPFGTYLDIIRKESVEKVDVGLAEVTQVLELLYGRLLELENLETCTMSAYSIN